MLRLEATRPPRRRPVGIPFGNEELQRYPFRVTKDSACFFPQDLFTLTPGLISRLGGRHSYVQCGQEGHMIMQANTLTGTVKKGRSTGLRCMLAGTFARKESRGSSGDIT